MADPVAIYSAGARSLVSALFAETGRDFDLRVSLRRVWEVKIPALSLQRTQGREPALSLSKGQGTRIKVGEQGWASPREPITACRQGSHA
jgi:hypothetical protein